jgi:hypothetical protein
VLGPTLKIAAAVLATGALVLAADPGSLAEGRPAASAPKVASYADYVALGDSYSAGPLIPAQRPDPLNCLRSTNNYPAFLAGYLAVSTYRDVTCSGARVRDFTSTQTTVIPGLYNPPPQLQALSAQTDLVTVGIGGNEFGLFGTMTSECAAVAPGDPSGAPCKQHFTNSKGVNTKYRDARRVQRHVGRGLAEIHRAAPNAKVLIVGYPRLLPSSGTCTAVPFAAGDYAFGRHVEYLLNRSIRRAAARHHATFVGTYGTSLGHDACAGPRAWINGSQNTAQAAAYHPFEKGERGLARAVYRKLTGSRAPVGGNASPPPSSIILNPPPSPTG